MYENVFPMNSFDRFSTTVMSVQPHFASIREAAKPTGPAPIMTADFFSFDIGTVTSPLPVESARDPQRMKRASARALKSSDNFNMTTSGKSKNMVAYG